LPSHGVRLTPRERKVAELLGNDLSNREIAERLGISEGTTRIDVECVLSKLCLTSRCQAAGWLATHPGHHHAAS
jgi:two-component system, NarL family, response regulator DevR